MQLVVQELYENLATKGIQITTDLIGRLAKVDKALEDLLTVLTKNNIQESISVGHEKYKGVDVGGQKVSQYSVYFDVEFWHCDGGSRIICKRSATISRKLSRLSKKSKVDLFSSNLRIETHFINFPNI